MQLSFQLLWVLLLWPLEMDGRASQKNLLDQGQVMGPGRPYIQGQLLTMAWHGMIWHGHKNVSEHEQKLIDFFEHEACHCCEPHPLEILCYIEYLPLLKGLITFCIASLGGCFPGGCFPFISDLCPGILKPWLFKPNPKPIPNPILNPIIG